MSDDLRRFYMRAAETPEGWYDPRSQMRAVSTGSAPRSSVAQMVSNHEIYHSHLATTTGYGTVSILVGALVHLGHGTFEGLFDQLLTQSFLCHEEYATVSSIFVSGKGQFQKELLRDFPLYQTFLSSWGGVLEEAPHPILAQIAIENLTRAAMQGGIDERLARLAPENWPNLDLADQDSPSARLDSLRDPAFLKVLFRARPDLKGGEDKLAERFLGGNVEPTESEALLRSDTGQRFLDQFAATYYRVAQHRLRAQNQICADFNGHSAFTETLIIAAQTLVGEVKLPFRRPREGEGYLDQVTAEIAQEYLVLSDELPVAIFADIRDTAELGSDFLLNGTGSESWVQIVAAPKSRLQKQYKIEDESAADLLAWPEDPLTCLRRRIVDPETGLLKYIEILGIPDIPTLHVFAQGWGEVGRVTASTSVLALQSDHWREIWLPVFQGIGVVPVLCDADPFALMRQWRRAEASVRYRRLSMAFEMGDGAIEKKVEVFCWKLEGQPLVFFCPVSSVTAGALERYARHLGATFQQDGQFLEDDREALLPAVSHLLQEERQFGFGWSGNWE